MSVLCRLRSSVTSWAPRRLSISSMGRRPRHGCEACLWMVQRRRLPLDPGRGDEAALDGRGSLSAALGGAFSHDREAGSSLTSLNVAGRRPVVLSGARSLLYSARRARP